MRKWVEVTVNTASDGVESGRADADVRMTFDGGDPKPDEEPDDIRSRRNQVRNRY
jgi:hypothetical protein